jgi:histidine triad (HIT) family protein
MVKDNDCLFCKIVNKEIPIKFIEESKNFVAFFDKYPLTKGHTLVIPKEHFVDLNEIPSELGKELIELIQKISEKRLKEGADGFNVLIRNGISAGQEVFHAHIHIIPRKKDDKIKSLPC